MIDGFTNVNGLRIHYITCGTHDPKKITLVFVPGIMMPAWIWEQQLAYFSQNYNVVAVEPRCHGDSDQTDEGLDALSMAKDIQAFVNDLNLESFVLIGWSLAVPQVVNYAAHFADKRLIGLVLVDGIVGIDSSWPFYQGMVDFWAQFPSVRAKSTYQFIQTIFKQPQSEAYYTKLSEVAMRMPTSTVMTLINNYIHQDFRSLLPKLDVPTWIATVEGPRLDYMKSLHNLIPNSKMEIFLSAGHTLFVDQPEKFNLSLNTFIHSLSNQPQKG